MDPSLDEPLANGAAGRLTAADRPRRLACSAVGDSARLDVSRAAPHGVPEVVFAEGQTTQRLIGIGAGTTAALIARRAAT